MDRIADMLAQLKNAQAVKHETVIIPFSRIKFELAKILQKNNLVAAVKTDEKKGKKVIIVDLHYQQGQPGITGAKRISKPSCRIYGSSKELRPVRQGQGIAVLSTSSGLMTDKEARKRKVGGEILCEIW